MMEKVRDTIRRHHLIQKDDRMVVGVSGGPDSLALLYILNGLKKELRFSLYVAHLDHMLRKDSYKDKAHVEKICKKLKLPLYCSQSDVRAVALKGSLEEVARNVRFRFLFQIARDLKAKKIALGHNQDDQAETVMMRILRGTGLFGLGGILPKREVCGFQIIRPLIEVKRREIEAFLRRKGIQACQDPTNQADVHFRNKIRRHLLPYLEKEFSTNIKGILCYMAKTCGQDYDFLSQLAQKALKRARIGKLKIGLKKLSGLHPSLERLVLRLMVRDLQGDLRRLTFKHIQELEDLILRRPVNSMVDLPKGISVIKRKTYLEFLKK
ncbi:MAG: tRNA lysidine(34) synthetase TilS [Candidatus Omnitrophota bacterium]